MLYLYLIVLIIQVSLAVFIFFLTISFITGAPFVPTTNTSAQTMISFADIKKSDTVYDLGSGNGKLLFLAASKGAQAVGYEINPILVLYTRILVFFSPYKKYIKVYWKSLWKAPVERADVIFLYLLPWRMDEVRRNFLHAMKPGTRVVSNSFLIPSWTPHREDFKNHIFLYIVK